MRISDTTPLQDGALMYNCTLNTKLNIQVSDSPPKPFHYYFYVTHWFSTPYHKTRKSCLRNNMGITC